MTENNEALLEMVNPVYKTAQSCVQLVASLGDSDAQRLLDALGFDSFGASAEKSPSPPEIKEKVMRLAPGYKMTLAARFYSTNRLIEESGAKRILDLPCGYTPRGLIMAAQGRTFFGFDLPAVINAMDPAVESLAGDAEKPLLRYRAVDATNYSALSAALGEPEGELLVTTEGLLMYLSQSELEEVFTNIRDLLRVHGGRWITMDRELTFHEGDVVAAGVNHDPELLGLLKGLSAKAAGNAAKVKLNNNVMFDPDQEKAERFVRDMGFTLRKLPVADYLPEDLCARVGLPGEVEGAVRELFRSIYFWEMRPVAGETAFRQEEKNFSAEAALRGDVLAVKLAGRMDTLTAPKLLSLYQEAAKQGSIRGIEVDLKELDYVSSAGLRVLLMMRKGLEDGERFHLNNAGPAVQEILETTGFDTIFF